MVFLLVVHVYVYDVCILPQHSLQRVAHVTCVHRLVDAPDRRQHLHPAHDLVMVQLPLVVERTVNT